MSLDARIRHDEPLAHRTTLGLGGPARMLVEVRSEDELVSALSVAHERRLRVAVLGGGSNVVIPDAGFDGLVIAMASRGIEVTAKGDGVHVRAAAGEPWDAFVAAMVTAGYQGIECLSGIPGLVGATPIQNVGAYGQEVKDTIVLVRALDRASVREGAARFETFGNAACDFAYRDSRFKRDPEAFVVTEVTFALRPDVAPRASYPELQRRLAGQAPSLLRMREEVIALRRSKSMVFDPADPDSHSAGSFFLNPIVSEAEASRVEALAAARGLVDAGRPFPAFPAADGARKLSAGWLIENAGIARGLSRGAVAISKAHALALVHHGGGTTRELLALADEVKAAVRAAWALELTREPVLFG